MAKKKPQDNQKLAVPSKLAAETRTVYLKFTTGAHSDLGPQHKIGFVWLEYDPTGRNPIAAQGRFDSGGKPPRGISQNSEYTHRITLPSTRKGLRFEMTDWPGGPKGAVHIPTRLQVWVMDTGFPIHLLDRESTPASPHWLSGWRQRITEPRGVLVIGPWLIFNLYPFRMPGDQELAAQEVETQTVEIRQPKS